MESFNPFAWESFYFGKIERKEAEDLLADAEVGTFLIRESSSTSGCYSLCVKVADCQVHNYLIEKLENQDGDCNYKISTRTFLDIPSILNHFKVHNLTVEPVPIKLIRPLEKGPIERVMTKYRFDGERITDLPFDRGEMLEILGKPENSWWLARNCLGDIGLIPSNRVKSCDDEFSLLNPSTNSGGESANRLSANSMNEQQQQQPQIVELPSESVGQQSLRPNSWVKVKIPRLPSIYDIESLIIKPGQYLFLQEICSNGLCLGANESGKVGLFPVTYVEPANIESGENPWNLSNGH